MVSHLHGVSQDFKFNMNNYIQLKIALCFGFIEARNWSDSKELAKAHVLHVSGSNKVTET